MGLMNIFSKDKNAEDKNKIINIDEIVRSSIMGFVVGDALGVPVEFKDRQHLKNNPVKKMEEYGTHYQPKGTWSDDSSMVIATIDAILSSEYKTTTQLGKKIMDSFYEWKKFAKYTPFDKVFDIGNATNYSISDYENKLSRVKGEVNDEQELKSLIECGSGDISSNGNGSLMRILPVAIYGYYKIKDDKEFNNFIFMISALTHSHIYSKLSCLIYSKYIVFLLEGNGKQDSYNNVKKWFKEIIIPSLQLSSEEIKVFDRIMTNDISKLQEKEIKSSGYVIDTLEATFWSILTTNSYKEAVLKAVNLGNDTDTIAALVGGLAGIIYGYDLIPKEWISEIQKKEYIMELIEKFGKELNKEAKEKNMDFDLDLLDKTIEDLKNNPNSCTLTEVRKTESGAITIPESMPSDQLINFFDYLYKTDKIDKEYVNKNIQKDVSEMNYSEVLTRLTSIIRGDRFVSGGLYGDVKSGLVLQLLNRLKDLLTNKEEIKTINGDDISAIVDDVVKKIENMADGESSSVYNLVDDKENVDLFEVYNQVEKKVEKLGIKLDYSKYDGMFVGLPYSLDFIKNGKNIKQKSNENSKYILKVEHTPFHNAYGLISELKTPDAIVKKIIPKVGETFDLDGIHIKILEVTDEYIKFLFPLGQGVYHDYELYKNKQDEVIELKVNERKAFNRDVMDCMEYWKVTFINTDIPEKEWKKCPKCGKELYEYIYGEPAGRPSDGYILGGCEITGHDPKYKCIHCNKDYYYEDINDSKIVLPNEIKDIQLPNLKSTSLPLENKTIENDDIIIFKISSGGNEYRLSFGNHDQKGWLDYSINNDINKLYHCILSEYMFKEFKKKIDELTKEWSTNYSGQNKQSSNWFLKEIKNGKLIKSYEGKNSYPDNWNEYLEYVKLFEIICKQNTKK